MVKSILHRLTPGPLLLKRSNKRTVMQFTDDVGMVYFGTVNHRIDDEHQLIRGLTVSPHHHDDHYSVGSLYTYDVALVERSDVLHLPKKQSQPHRWLIMQFDLHSTKDLPHIFLGLHTHSEIFYANLFAKFNQLQKVPLGTFGMYDKAFKDRYAVYTTPAESLTAERLLDNEVTKVIGNHFGTLTVEISEGSLYLYSEHVRISKNLLQTMLQNGIWLAKHIDARAEVL
jgi:hypothetical protein